MRQPWTEPYSRKERLLMRGDYFAYRWGIFWTESVPHWIARHLPHAVKKWVLVDAAANAWAAAKTISPDALTYPMMYDHLEQTKT
jgi:hypothetical protein